MLDGKGHIRLTDFGLSKIMLEDDELAFSLCGTPEYLAPEILTTSDFILYIFLKRADTIKTVIGGAM